MLYVFPFLLFRYFMITKCFSGKWENLTHVGLGLADSWFSCIRRPGDLAGGISEEARAKKKMETACGFPFFFGLGLLRNPSSQVASPPNTGKSRIGQPKAYMCQVFLVNSMDFAKRRNQSLLRPSLQWFAFEPNFQKILKKALEALWTQALFFVQKSFFWEKKCFVS